MAKQAFEDKLVAKAKAVRRLIQDKKDMEAQAADFANRCNVAKSAVAKLTILIEEATVELRKVAVEDD